MELKFGNVALSAWKGISVCSQIDESKDEVEKFAIYTDHGDDFLLVKTKDGKMFKYGYFLNLKYPPREFIRTTVLYRKEDEGSCISNKIFFRIYGDHGDNFIDRMTYRINEDSEGTANFKLRFLARQMQEIYSSGVMYHNDQFKDIVKRYLTVNGIDTEENYKILDNIVFDTSYYGIDGIAGKIEEFDDGWIYGDRLKYAYENGKRIWLKRRFVSCDEWGTATYRWKF